MVDIDIEELGQVLTTAGKAIMEVYGREPGGQNLTLKSDDSPLTEADIRANDIITAFLQQRYPDIPIISEENELLDYEIRKGWEYVWLLDPLDGTKEFINRTGEFSINLALVQAGKAVIGCIYLPVDNEFYFAKQGSGSFMVKDGKQEKLMANTVSLHQGGLRVVTSRSHMDDLTRKAIDKLDNPQLIVLGSALKFLSIAKGQADYYPRMIHIMEWDTAAGQVIIEEAGGSLIDAIFKRPLQYNKPTMVNPMFIAAANITKYED